MEKGRKENNGGGQVDLKLIKVMAAELSWMGAVLNDKVCLFESSDLWLRIWLFLVDYEMLSMFYLLPLFVFPNTTLFCLCLKPPSYRTLISSSSSLTFTASSMQDNPSFHSTRSSIHKHFLPHFSIRRIHIRLTSTFHPTLPRHLNQIFTKHRVLTSPSVSLSKWTPRGTATTHLLSLPCSGTKGRLRGPKSRCDHRKGTAVNLMMTIFRRTRQCEAADGEPEFNEPHVRVSECRR